MKVLTIESTCDETAAAVITGDLEVLSGVVASQEELHRKFNGVVPEIAARAHVERILPVIDEALRKANTERSELDAIAVANEPGLSGSLLVGMMAAKSLCLALNIPLVTINHLHAHVYACQLESDESIFPCLGFIVSGGHTSFYRCESPLNFELLGGTIDDAAGEAFDKVASMLGLGYPGGPAISKRAVSGNPDAYDFPKSFVNDPKRLQFSFSGLKTAVRYAITGPGSHDFQSVELSSSQIDDICASFQKAVVDCLIAKVIHAVKHTNLHQICVGGGVAANPEFRERLKLAGKEECAKVQFASPKLCTDNAVMGAIAIEKLKVGMVEDLTVGITPGLVRQTTK